TPHEPHCPICKHTYNQAMQNEPTHLSTLILLPNTGPRLYIQTTINPLITPCGHTFCTLCICTWLHLNTASTCLICRSVIPIPHQAFEDENDDFDAREIAIDGLRISLSISPPAAREIYTILKLSTRGLLTTHTAMPMVWHAETMVADLPKVMVGVARRFHVGNGNGVRDLAYLKLRSLLQSASTRDRDRELKFFERADAPLAKHGDARRLYEVLCERILSLENAMGDVRGRWCDDWRGAVELLGAAVGDEMADADGGVGKLKWAAYVRCVVKVLVVWQAYCERVRKLAAGSDAR
ncbi:hypothetical protein CC86DRAFT_293477, partial [Ophiobolus disseminans]